MAHKVVLNWTASPTPNAVYDIYRGASAGGESGSPINSPNHVTGTTYTDTNASAGTPFVAGQKVFYEVVAVDPVSGLTSPASNEASATIPADPTEEAPSNLTATAS